MDSDSIAGLSDSVVDCALGIFDRLFTGASP